MSPTPTKTTHAASPQVVTNNGPWFAVSLALMGVIVGYAAGSMQGGLRVTGANPTVAQAPAAAAPAAAPTPAPTPTNETPPSVDDDAMLGDEDATITVVEFTDYQCPFCARHYTQTHKEIVKNYVDTGKVKLVVRDYPLSFHPNAQKAGEATECAEDQDKFWEMHDKLFETAATWSSTTDSVTTFTAFAKELGMDEEEFKTCLTDGTHAEEVKKDMADGSKSGISGTPGFWIIDEDGKGQKISGAYPYATFQAAFDALL